MECAVDTDSGAMIYIPSFIKTGSAIQTLIREIHSYTDITEIAQA
jgi:hypothetical protein